MPRCKCTRTESGVIPVLLGDLGAGQALDERA